MIWLESSFATIIGIVYGIVNSMTTVPSTAGDSLALIGLWTFLLEHIWGGLRIVYETMRIVWKIGKQSQKPLDK
jgi:xanthosine utilization system XapX-like protein